MVPIFSPLRAGWCVNMQTSNVWARPLLLPPPSSGVAIVPNAPSSVLSRREQPQRVAEPFCSLVPHEVVPTRSYLRRPTYSSTGYFQILPES
eukprot:SAG11_NODE_419_length_9648_cov_6.815478_6_plen_92_part_00